MDVRFMKIDPMRIEGNAIQMIGNEWMLITAGKKSNFNTMTASWGGMGYLWRKPVTFIFVRPQRYTFRFTEKYQYYTLCFFDEKYRDSLTFCGTNSGRDVDKIKECGFTVRETKRGNVYFEEARLVFECRKIYADNIKPANFLDPGIDRLYKLKDYHRTYIGEIIETLRRYNS